MKTSGARDAFQRLQPHLRRHGFESIELLHAEIRY